MLVASLMAAIGLASCVGSANPRQPSKPHAEEGMTEIVVRLRPETARAIQSGAQDDGRTRELKAVLSQFHVELKPQHPGTPDSQLQAYFTISGVPIAQAERIAAALRDVDTVEAAYVQPSATPP
jgi:hypothetical protein